MRGHLRPGDSVRWTGSGNMGVEEWTVVGDDPTRSGRVVVARRDPHGWWARSPERSELTLLPETVTVMVTIPHTSARDIERMAEGSPNPVDPSHPTWSEPDQARGEVLFYAAVVDALNPEPF